MTNTGAAGVDLAVKTFASLILLIAFAVVLPGGCLLLPLAYAKYRRRSPPDEEPMSHRPPDAPPA